MTNKTPTAGRPRKVMIEHIEYDSENQARERLDNDTVADYADAMERKEKLPPIVCYHDGSTYWLADGFHRYHAARKRGEKYTEAQVIKGSRDDARWHAAGANKDHGLKRTTADKQKAVRLALALRPNLSDSKIAKHCGVSDKTVAAQRAKMSGSEIPNLTDQRRLGLDGKMYPARRDSFREEATQSPAEPSDPWHDSDEGDEPAAAPAKRAGAKPEPLRDATGTAVPDEIAEAFQDHKDEVNALLAIVGNARSAVMSKEGESGYERVVFSILKAAFETVTSTLRQTAYPQAVCPYCSGSPRACKPCEENGWVVKAHFESLPDILTKVRR
jgi:hypothetical protein